MRINLTADCFFLFVYMRTLTITTYPHIRSSLLFVLAYRLTAARKLRLSDYRQGQWQGFVRVQQRPTISCHHCSINKHRHQVRDIAERRCGRPTSKCTCVYHRCTVAFRMPCTDRIVTRTDSTACSSPLLHCPRFFYGGANQCRNSHLELHLPLFFQVRYSVTPP